MTSRGETLRAVMAQTDTTQSQLSRVSGVKQPSISQYLSGRTELSDDMLERLLVCMGYRLEVVRRPIKPELDRSRLRSWMLHRRLSSHLTGESLQDWVPTLLHNVDRLRAGIQGQPHDRNLDRWSSLIASRDVAGIQRVMTGLDNDSVQMREVSPMGGLLSQDERALVLDELSR